MVGPNVKNVKVLGKFDHQFPYLRVDQNQLLTQVGQMRNMPDHPPTPKPLGTVTNKKTRHLGILPYKPGISN